MNNTDVNNVKLNPSDNELDISNTNNKIPKHTKKNKVSADRTSKKKLNIILPLDGLIYVADQYNINNKPNLSILRANIGEYVSVIVKLKYYDNKNVTIYTRPFLHKLLLWCYENCYVSFVSNLPNEDVKIILKNILNEKQYLQTKLMIGTKKIGKINKFANVKTGLAFKDYYLYI